MNKKEIIVLLTVIVVMTLFILWVYPIVKSYENGGPTFPNGCLNKFSENVTYSGQVIRTYPWSDKCCTKRYTGYTTHNNYEKVCWDKIKGDANVATDDGVKE